MREIYSLRLSREEKEALQHNYARLGFKTSSDFARELLKIGLRNFNITPKEKHVLHNSAQSVMLLREVISLLSGNSAQSTQLINDVKNLAEDWTSKVEKSLHL